MKNDNEINDKNKENNDIKNKSKNTEKSNSNSDEIKIIHHNCNNKQK